MSTNIDSLLRQVRERGLRVNNWFHRMDGMWQANLRSKDGLSFFEFAYGVDPSDAMEKALVKVDEGKKVPAAKRTSDDDLNPRTPGLVRHDPPPTALPDDASAASDDDLIG